MPLTQAELEAQLMQQEQSAARHMIKVVKALIDNRLDMHEVDFDALTQKVSAINTLLDGDEQNEGYQAFAALTTKLAAVELKGNTNAAAITALQTALTNELATLTTRVDQVESDAQAGRAALDLRIDTLRSEYEAHVASQLVADTAQNQALADHQTRIVALESSQALIDARVVALESDNTQNKSAIAAIQATLTAQSQALQAELTRAQNAEAAIQAELVAERARIDGLVTQAGTFATRQNVSDANQVGAMSAVSAMWDEAGIVMPTGLAMPDGSVSQ